jgi:hypothetical protein
MTFLLFLVGNPSAISETINNMQYVGMHICDDACAGQVVKWTYGSYYG